MPGMAFVPISIPGARARQIQDKLPDDLFREAAGPHSVVFPAGNDTLVAKVDCLGEFASREIQDMPQEPDFRSYQLTGIEQTRHREGR